MSIMSKRHHVAHVKLKESGFTLVEVLVAMVIFALLMILVSNAMSFSFNFWSRNHSQLDTKVDEFIIFEKLSRATKATQPYGVFVEDGKVELFFKGSEQYVSFVSDIGLYQPGPSLIQLQVSSNELGEQRLEVSEHSMSEWLFTEEKQLSNLQFEWQTLFSQVRSVRFEYFGYRNLASLNQDLLNNNPLAALNKNKAWLNNYSGETNLILPEVIKLSFEQFRKGNWVQRTMSFKIQINDVRRYIFLHQNKEAV